MKNKIIFSLCIFSVCILSTSPYPVSSFTSEQVIKNSSVQTFYKGRRMSGTVFAEKFVLLNYHLLDSTFHRRDSIKVLFANNKVTYGTVSAIDSINDLLLLKIDILPFSKDSVLSFNHLYLRKESPSSHDFFIGRGTPSDKKTRFLKSFFLYKTNLGYKNNVTYHDTSYAIHTNDSVKKSGLCGTIMMSKNSFGLVHAENTKNAEKIYLIPNTIILDFLKKTTQ